MAQADDVLAGEVAITAKLEETGISLKAKSRAVAAIDRLLGGLADWPAAFFEGRAAKRRLKDEIAQKLLQLQGELAERKLEGIEQAGDALLVGVLKDAGRKQLNVASVVIEAVEEIKALPAPEQVRSTDASDEPDEVDEDWLNQFMRFAEDASSDDLQQLWGRVLAGEVNRPGAFSRHTLRFIAELDKTTADHCEVASEFSFKNFIPIRNGRNLPFDLRIALDLQRLGILEGVSGDSSLATDFIMKSNTPNGFAKGNKVLLVYGSDGYVLKIPSIVVTRLGNEIFSLIKTRDPKNALNSLAEILKMDNGVKSLLLANLGEDLSDPRYYDAEAIFVRQ